VGPEIRWAPIQKLVQLRQRQEALPAPP
jgi:hypothetical protein